MNSATLRVSVAPALGPRSFQRYADAVCAELPQFGIQILPWDSPADLAWNPYGGWGEPARIPQDRYVPLVLTFHGGAAWSKPLSAVFGYEPSDGQIAHVESQKKLWRGCFERSSAVLVPSEYSKNELECVFQAGKRCSVVPLGVDLHTFRPDGDLIEGIGFLHVSTGAPVKNVELIINAYAHLEGKKPPLTLVIPPQRCPEQLPDGVRCHPPVSDDLHLAKLYRSAVALVQPSLWETFGLPVLEAAACGTPAIVAPGSALQELWSGMGWVLATSSTQDLIHAMNAMSNPDIRQQFAMESIKTAQRLSWKRCAEQTARILKRNAIVSKRGWRQVFRRFIK